MTIATSHSDKPRSSREPELDESTRTFLRLAIMAILGGALAFIAVILIFAPDQVRRLANPLAGIGIALTSWALLKKEHFRASIMVLTVGTWLVTTAIAISSGGVRTPVVYSLPVIVFFAGWLLGSRMAIAMAILSVTTYLAMAILEHQGRLPQIPYTPAFMHWVIQATIEAISLMGRLEGLAVDPVYSGKGLAGLIALIRAGRWSRGDNVVFVHTGGEPGLFAYASVLAGM